MPISNLAGYRHHRGWILASLDYGTKIILVDLFSAMASLWGDGFAGPSRRYSDESQRGIC